MRALAWPVTLVLSLALVPGLAPCGLPSARAEAPLIAGRTLTLREALDQGRAHQPSLRSARANTELERGRSDAARASLLPQAAATAAYQRTTANFVFRPGFNSASTANTARTPNGDLYNFYNFGVTGSQLLYDFGASYEAYRAGKERVKSVSASERTSALSVDYEVRSAFFAARAKQAALTVAEETLKNQERHAAQVEAFVSVGARPAIDRAQSRTDVANARVTHIRAKNDYDLARAQLNQAMGVEATLDYVVADETLGPVDLEDASLDTLLRAAIAGRPDLQSLAILRRAQQLSLRAAKGQYGPALSATGAVTEAGTELDNLVWNWNVGLSLSFTFLQGWLTHANIRQAKANLASVEAQLDALRLTVRLDLTRGQLAVHSARAALDAAGEALENAHARLGLAEGRYEAGVGNIIELGDAQFALTSAEFQRVQAEYDLASARAQLLSALGRSE
jgi:outer membrane protein